MEARQGYDAPPGGQETSRCSLGAKTWARSSVRFFVCVPEAPISRDSMQERQSYTNGRATGTTESFGEVVLKNRQVEEIEWLAPDHSFLIEEIFNDFDTVPHLDLSLFRHREHSSDQLAGFHIHK